ncbi:MAG: Rieske 2Fe-2S domain-containing protein [Gemmatimonadaceae bacterium]
MREDALAAVAILRGLGAALELLATELPSVAAHDATGTTRVYSIPPVDGATVDPENEVLLVRWAGWAYAFALACPHRGTRLEWHASESRAFCPKHKTRFRPDRVHDSGRQTRALDRYNVRRASNGLAVQIDVGLRIDKELASWEAATVRLA